MNREINPRWAILAIVVVVLALGYAAWRLWATPGGLRTPEEAGLGRPMKPGEIPGKSQGVETPITPTR